jgi:MarR family transcriptional regulator, temperature-dependent positive regulator of motility
MPSKATSGHSSGSILHVVVGSVPVTRFPGPLARRLNQICLTAVADALRPLDLAPLQWSMLAYVCNEPELDQTGLAARVAVDRANAGILIDQLESRGLVERRVHPDDRRIRQVLPTKAGAALYKRLSPEIIALQHSILEAALTKAEASTLLDLMIRVIRANEGRARPGGGRRKRLIRPSDSAHTTKEISSRR